MQRLDFLLINRSFWPKSRTIGEGHLLLAEKLSVDHSVGVFFVKSKNFVTEIKKRPSASKVKFIGIKFFDTSASNIFFRLLELMFFSVFLILALLWYRPRVIYFSTDPPILIGLVVVVFSLIAKLKYIYHYQDIHPEITNQIYNMPLYFYKPLLMLDKLVQKRASHVITISNRMSQYLSNRINSISHITLLDNPTETNFKKLHKNPGFVFSGTAGRVQNIPLLIDSIKSYLDQGGTLSFTFIGSGIYESYINELAKKYDQVNALGYISSAESNSISSSIEWAILPLQSKISNFAFPSKTSSYVLSRNKILAIVDDDDYLAKWISETGFGISVNPNIAQITKAFFMIEKQMIDVSFQEEIIENLASKMSSDYFASIIKNILLKEFHNE